jgi:hypothetical protein
MKKTWTALSLLGMTLSATEATSVTPSLTTNVSVEKSLGYQYIKIKSETKFSDDLNAEKTNSIQGEVVLPVAEIGAIFETHINDFCIEGNAFIGRSPNHTMIADKTDKDEVTTTQKESVKNQFYGAAIKGAYHISTGGSNSNSSITPYLGLGVREDNLDSITNADSTAAPKVQLLVDRFYSLFGVSGQLEWNDIVSSSVSMEIQRDTQVKFNKKELSQSWNMSLKTKIAEFTSENGDKVSVGLSTTRLFNEKTNTSWTQDNYGVNFAYKREF